MLTVMSLPFPCAWASEASPAEAGATVLSAIGPTVEKEIEAGHIPGAVVLVGQRDRILYRRAFGDRALLPARLPMTTDTIFDLASLTKVLATTVAVMQLAETGQLHLSDPVSNYWPAFAQNGKGGITVEHLLTHTSGLRPDLDLRQLWHGEAAARSLILAERPIAAPGTKFLYSDINFIVLGELVQRISGEPLDIYAARHIFGPLGMKDTGFNPPPSARTRIAPTDLQNGVLRWGMVQDPTAYRMGGVAGHAGLFGTADDLAIFAQMLLNGGSFHGRRILSAASVLRMTLPRSLPSGARRGLGWDIDSPFAGGQDVAFGPESYGHTGYSGTSLWIDPKRGCYLIILTSRLHPSDRGDTKPLRDRLARIVEGAVPPPVLTGIDVLEAAAFAPLVGRRVGLLTNQTGRDAAGRRTIDILAQAPGVHLLMIFSPEHGLGGDREGRIASGTEPSTGLPVYSLYGRDLRPSAAVLSQLDAIVVDLQDVGVRFYTYAATMAYVMEAAARAGIFVYVLDRPNPITAAVVDGPISDVGRRSITGYFPMPVRHGMTLGELAEMFNAEYGIGAKLVVIPMHAYSRNLWYDETGLGWVNPSPHLRSLEEVILYPGVALIEAANVSVGRGTAEPFELVGAPWIDGKELAEYLERRAIPGVRFEAVDFTPAEDRYAGELCHGVRIILTDRTALHAPRLGIELAAALHRLYPDRFQIARILGLVGSQKTLAAIENGADPQAIESEWQEDLAAFQALRAKYLLYQ
ncbi:MAG: DUF1343 domain-containing protein [Acidobacteriia bacterium]|nr:DUF1343 domain-containing protein [Methyloceanibacter sp.]MCL6492884.1 DUF1343 domain-containing protein [Terriglobia bacterium]